MSRRTAFPQLGQVPRVICGARKNAACGQRAEQTAERLRVAAGLRCEEHRIRGTPGQDVGDAELCGDLDHARAMTCRDHRAHRERSGGLCSAHAGRTPKNSGGPFGTSVNVRR